MFTLPGVEHPARPRRSGAGRARNAVAWRRIGNGQTGINSSYWIGEGLFWGGDQGTLTAGISDAMFKSMNRAIWCSTWRIGRPGLPKRPWPLSSGNASTAGFALPALASQRTVNRSAAALVSFRTPGGSGIRESGRSFHRTRARVLFVVLVYRPECRRLRLGEFQDLVWGGDLAVLTSDRSHSNWARRLSSGGSRGWPTEQPWARRSRRQARNRRIHRKGRIPVCRQGKESRDNSGVRGSIWNPSSTSFRRPWPGGTPLSVNDRSPCRLPWPAAASKCRRPWFRLGIRGCPSRNGALLKSTPALTFCSADAGIPCIWRRHLPCRRTAILNP